MSREPSYNRYKRAHYVKETTGDWIAAKERDLDTRPRNNDRFHTVIRGERMDLLAYRFWGDSRLWWVLATYNDRDWMFDLKPGDVLRYPTYETLYMELLT